MSAGDTTTHGRVFLISLPTVGSRLTSQISPRVTRPAPNPPHYQIRPSRVRRRLLPRYSWRPRPNLRGPDSRACAAPVHHPQSSFPLPPLRPGPVAQVPVWG